MSQHMFYKGKWTGRQMRSAGDVELKKGKGLNPDWLDMHSSSSM